MKELSKSYKMHYLVLKTTNPDSNYGPSKLATVCNDYTLLLMFNVFPAQFPGQWTVSHTQVLHFPPKCISWNRDGSQLLAGGTSISLWSSNQEPAESNEGVAEVTWAEVWRCDMGQPIVHLKFSPDGTFFASAGEVRDVMSQNIRTIFATYVAIT